MIVGLGVNEVVYVVGFHYLKSMETHSDDVIVRNVCKRYFLCGWFIFWLDYRLRYRLLKIRYLFLYLAFHNLAKKCVISLCRSLRASGNGWLDTFLQYDFDDAYFNDVDSNNAGEDNDDDWMDSECDSEKESKFNLVNPIVREMYAYM